MSQSTGGSLSFVRGVAAVLGDGANCGDVVQGVPVRRQIQAPPLRAVLLPGYRSCYRVGPAAGGGWRSGVPTEAQACTSVFLTTDKLKWSKIP